MNDFKELDQYLGAHLHHIHAGQPWQNIAHFLNKLRGSERRRRSPPRRRRRRRRIQVNETTNNIGKRTNIIEMLLIFVEFFIVSQEPDDICK